MIYAGPFIGEFGWELCCWQGYLRHLASQGEQTSVCGGAAMRIAPGVYQCETCGAVYAHDQGYHHWLASHATKDQTVTRKEILPQQQKGKPV